MLLSELGDLSARLSGSLLSCSPLWRRDVSTLTPLDFDLFVRAHGGSSVARQEVRATIDAGLMAMVEGQIEDAGFVSYVANSPALTSAELARSMSEVSVARRRALLFALDMNLTPRAVMELTHRKLRALKLTPLAKQCVAAMPRHIRLDFVFWDYLPTGSAAPLFGLNESALEVSQGLGFTQLRSRYARMVWIDPGDAAEQCMADLRHAMFSHH